MRRTLMLLLLGMITLATTPLLANPMRKAHTSPNPTASRFPLENKCYADDADGLNAQNKSVTIQWVLKLNSGQQGGALIQRKQKQFAPQLFGVKQLQPTPLVQQTPSQAREVFNGPITKITAASAAAASVALILKLMLGKPACGPQDKTPDTKQRWTKLKPLKKYKAIHAYKPGEVLTCVGCGQQPIEGAGQSGGGFDDQYRGDASTGTSNSASQGFRGRSITGHTPAAASRYSSRRTSSSPQLATPNTRVNLGRSSIGKR